MKFLLAYHDTNSKSCSESRIKFLFRLSFALNGQFFPVYQVHTFLAGIWNNFQNHRRVSEQLLKPQAAIRKPEFYN
jgi:hypothetical protein